MPIHVYVQYASDGANVWRDITPNTTGNPCWSTAPASNPSVAQCEGSDAVMHDGVVTVSNIPAGAEVWVTVHLDYRLKGTVQNTTTFLKQLYFFDFSSKAELRAAGTPLLIGTSSRRRS